jgi:DNA-binding LacI/PurR family transcriptional regulator
MPHEAAARARSRHANILDVAALAGVSAATVSASSMLRPQGQCQRKRERRNVRQATHTT